MNKEKRLQEMILPNGQSVAKQHIPRKGSKRNERAVIELHINVLHVKG